MHLFYSLGLVQSLHIQHLLAASPRGWEMCGAGGGQGQCDGAVRAWKYCFAGSDPVNAKVFMSWPPSHLGEGRG